VQDVFGLVNIMQNSDGNEKNPQRTEEFQITITSEVHTAEQGRGTQTCIPLLDIPSNILKRQKLS